MNISDPKNNLEFAYLNNSALTAVQETEKQLINQTGQQVILVAYENK